MRNSNHYPYAMKNFKNPTVYIFLQSLVATLWSLYYWWFWDPVKNYIAGNLFDRNLWYTPCEMCRFARVLMYPILIISFIAIMKKDKSAYQYIQVLSWLWILLESYQYRFQMTSTTAEVESFICGWLTGVSCAAVDVIYIGFITIPLLCLIAFIVIFILTIFWQYNLKKQW